MRPSRHDLAPKEWFNATPARQSDADNQDLVPDFLSRYDRENTRRAYRTVLAQFFGGPRVSLDAARSVTSVHVNVYMMMLEKRGLSPSTISQRVTVLRTFYRWLAARGMVSRNPAARELVRRIPAQDRRTRHIDVLTLEQTRALLSAVDMTHPAGVRNYALLLTLVKCCLRRSEAAGLCFEHVRRVGPYFVLGIPHAKGGANQAVKAPTDVVASIAAVRDEYGFGSGPVFRSLATRRRADNHMPGSSIDRIVKDVAAAAGLPPISPHVLRHTGCTLALEGGASVQQVQTHARHRKVSTTLVYVHQRDRLSNSAADFISVGL